MNILTIDIYWYKKENRIVLNFFFSRIEFVCDCSAYKISKEKFAMKKKGISSKGGHCTKSRNFNNMHARYKKEEMYLCKRKKRGKMSMKENYFNVYNAVFF